MWSTLHCNKNDKLYQNTSAYVARFLKGEEWVKSKTLNLFSPPAIFCKMTTDLPSIPLRNIWPPPP